VQHRFILGPILFMTVCDAFDDDIKTDILNIADDDNLT